MAGSVASLNSALGVMGYVSLPTGSFDANGNVVVPSDFQLPARWSETVGRVTESPDFATLLRILGTLTVPGTDWYCWRVALSFSGGTLRVIIVRDIWAAGGNETVGLNWSNNLWSSVLTPLKSFTGRQRLLSPVAMDALKSVISEVSGSGYWDKPLSNDKAREALALRKWKVTSALNLIGAFASLMAGITTTSKVLTTVLWYNSKRPSVPSKEITWRPLFQMYDAWNLRAIHYRWKLRLVEFTTDYLSLRLRGLSPA